MAEMWCPMCPSHVVVPWRMVGSTQWYICENNHKFPNPIIISNVVEKEEEPTTAA